MQTDEITIRDVEIRYSDRGRKHETFVAACDINLMMERGEFVALVGKSGCGKTSILNALAALLPPETYVGDILIRGRSPREMRSEVGYMLARDALLPWRSALKNVELPLQGSMSRRQRRERCRELLDRVGLSQFEKRLPHQLSQGMRQRVALARTISTDPSIILADEPFAALDAQTRLSVQEMFLREWERQDRTTVLVTHDLQEAILLADRVVIMAGQPGRIAVDQRVNLPRPRANHLVDLFTSEAFRDMYHQLFDDLQRASNASGEVED